MKNILILSAASKVSLINSFKEAIINIDTKLFVSDLDPSCTAGFFSDGHVDLPRSTDASYGKILLDQCREKNIGLVVPTRDAELLPLAKMKNIFRNDGVEIMTPELKNLNKCQDKFIFATTIIEMGYKAILTYDYDSLQEENFPLFLKPRKGSASKDIYLISTMSELKKMIFTPEKVLLQEYITDPEYSIDALFDFGSNPIQAVMRTRENVLNGESQKSRIINAPDVTNQCLELGLKLGLVGHNVFQVFWDGKNLPTFIEVNPRFGGASNASITAGLSSPKKILNFAFGSEEQRESARKPNEIKYEMIMQRYSTDHFYINESFLT